MAEPSVDPRPRRSAKLPILIGLCLLALVVLVGGAATGLYLNRDKLVALLPIPVAGDGGDSEPAVATGQAQRPVVATAPIQAGEHDYANYTQRDDVLVMVDYYADWCGPCRGLAPHLERLASEHGDAVVVLKVNVDQQRELATRAGVRGIPDIRLLHDGKQLEKIVGGVPYGTLESLVLRHRSRLPAVSSPPDAGPAATPAGTGEPSITPLSDDWLPPGIERRTAS